jgi:hypothetical protein
VAAAMARPARSSHEGTRSLRREFGRAADFCVCDPIRTAPVALAGFFFAFFLLLNSRLVEGSGDLGLLKLVGRVNNAIRRALSLRIQKSSRPKQFPRNFVLRCFHKSE